ncbi:MAG: gamma-glutamylcyclotransferase family protein [Novosphingobium sp.]
MRLFLYGTLIGASDTAMARWLAPRLREAVGGSVPGRLVAIPSPGGWFPALIRESGGERVWGMICRADFAPGELARLDRYEGAEYRRAAAIARTEDGLLLTVQLYRWRAPLPGGAEPIRGGDFLAWLAKTGRKPFSVPRNGR